MTEPLRVWAFHFPPGVDNSGFVGWLATHVKRAAGSGVAVVCGPNAARGGIYDYWACPAAAGDAVLAAVGAVGATVAFYARVLGISPRLSELAP